MRILLINWARPWDGTRSGGGVNGYLQGLALALVQRGHDVNWLCSGTTYVPGDGQAGAGGPAPCEIRRHDDWLGLRVFEIINSPVLAPALLQFADPEAEISSPELEARFGELLELLKPEVVHFHNIEGLSAGCAHAAKASGARVYWSLHNYHTACPQVYLMRGHRTPCHTFDSGRACEGCIEAPDPAEERAARAAAYPGEPAPWHTRGQSARPAPEPHNNGRLALPLLHRVMRRPGPSAPRPAAAPPGRPLEFELRAQERPEDHRGQTDRIRAERRGDTWFTPQDPTWIPLSNDVTPDPIEPRPPRYGHRRAAMLEALSACDGVLAVSSHVRARYEALGVPPDRLHTLHIGTTAGDIARRRAELAFAPPPRDAISPPRPLRLVFMGVNHWYKGLSMLADSLDLLDARWLNRLDLTVVAAGGASIEYRFRRMEPRLARLTFHEGYEPPDIPWICGGQDIGVVPSVWWDNGPQTVMEFLACGLPVLGAEIGGIPDFVTHGANGLLFRANDRFDLSRTLAKLIDDPALTGRLRAGVKSPKTMETHAAELEQVYQQGVPSETAAAR